MRRLAALLALSAALLTACGYPGPNAGRGPQIQICPPLCGHHGRNR